MVEENTLLAEAVQEQAGTIPPDFTSFTIEVRCLAGVGEGQVFLDVDGVQSKIDIERSTYGILRQHRGASYKPGLGAWFAARVAVYKTGVVDAGFDYEGEPDWVFDARNELYVADFIRFPRDAQHAPAWLVKKLRPFEKEIREQDVNPPWE